MPKFLVVAGEPSGDLHGASLLRHLKEMGSDFEAFGIGGDRMQDSGLELVHHFRDLSVVGFSEVVHRLPALRIAMRDLFYSMLNRHPDIVILIDYPGFNLRFAKLAKLRGYRTVYYITPQIWAWGGWRMSQIARYLDKVIVVLPFEKRLYEDTGLDVSLVGHPLLDTVEAQLDRNEFCSRLGLDPAAPVVGILPGSREDEVRRILPLMLLSVQTLASAQFVLPLSPQIGRAKVDRIVDRLLPQVRVVQGMTYEAMSSSDLLLVASGTATLEAAILGTPMLIVYKVSLISWPIARLLVKVPHIGLVNIVAGRKVAPEFVQFQATPRRLSRAIERLISDEDARAMMRAELGKVRARLGDKGAARRAARIVMSMVQ